VVVTGANRAVKEITRGLRRRKATGRAERQRRSFELYTARSYYRTWHTSRRCPSLQSALEPAKWGGGEGEPEPPQSVAERGSTEKALVELVQYWIPIILSGYSAPVQLVLRFVDLGKNCCLLPIHEARNARRQGRQTASNGQGAEDSYVVASGKTSSITAAYLQAFGQRTPPTQ